MASDDSILPARPFHCRCALPRWRSPLAPGAAAAAFDFFHTSAAPGALAQPKSFVVSDFTFSSDVTAVDRGYTARLQRKIGAFPAHERKQRTIERVNDEIVAAIIATLDEAGLKAGPGREEGLTLNDDVVLVSGRLRVSDRVKLGKDKQVGFGVGDGRVTADMAVSHFSGGGKNLLLQFDTQMPGGRAAKARSQAAGGAQRGDRGGAVGGRHAGGEAVAGDRGAGARDGPRYRRAHRRLCQGARLADDGGSGRGHAGDNAAGAEAIAVAPDQARRNVIVSALRAAP